MKLLGLRSNLWLISIIVIAVILCINNTAYYYLTKNTLEDNLSRELTTVANQIQVSIEQSRLGAEIYQNLIGEKLRIAAISAQEALDPDIENVSNNELVTLSKRLGVEHITLLKKTDDNIVLYKSSNPKQLGIKTKGWQHWYTAFQQLFEDRNVSIDWGQKLPNFWSGPYEYSTSDPDKIMKWGYYHDGRTNYIVDPFVEFDNKYEVATGINAIVANTIKINKTVIEITGINPATFDNGPITTLTDRGDRLGHMTQLPIIFGSYAFPAEDDRAIVKEVVATGKSQTMDTMSGGKHVLKMFIPIPIEKVASILDTKGEKLDYYVLSLVSDYKIIQDQLDEQVFSLGATVLIVSLLSLIIIILAIRYFSKSRDKAVSETQKTYIDEMNQMFQSISAQRHDFLNHAQTIHMLVDLGKHNELKSYTKDLIGEIREVSNIIHIGNPAIAALVQSKIAIALDKKITFEYEFSSLTKMEMGVKSLDLVIIIGNLIDNAFDEVLKFPVEQRRVRLKGWSKDGDLFIVVNNYGRLLTPQEQINIFKPGFSTKSKREHSGLGLSIVKRRVEQHRGSITLSCSEEEGITFQVIIPHTSILSS